MPFGKQRLWYKLEGKIAVQCDSLLEWADWLETADRRVAETQIGDIWVSTVFLGMDHGFFSDDPLLFETLVFPTEEFGTMVRYFTWEEAEEGHRKVVQAIQAMIEQSQAITRFELFKIVSGA